MLINILQHFPTTDTGDFITLSSHVDVIPSIDPHTDAYFFGSITLMTLCVMMILHAFSSGRREANFIKKLYEIEEEEYDFMSSGEGFHSQLDVASAYIDMSLFDDAMRIIDDIRPKTRRNEELRSHLRSVEAKFQKNCITID
tara:strand:- start:1829 stop:2254 length:426 start_codon:yes stop_codon:yes gene_type:complete